MELSNVSLTYVSASSGSRPLEPTLQTKCVHLISFVQNAHVCSGRSLRVEALREFKPVGYSALVAMQQLHV